MVLSGKIYSYHIWCGGCSGCGGYGVEGEVFCISVGGIPICVLFAVCAGDF